jgi:predicted ATP-grasp superfamily ATP-dependent carboligase
VTDPAPGSPDPIVVTDGDTRQSLALVRAFGRRGLRAEVIADRHGSMAGASRFASAEHRLGDPEREPERWAAAVRDLLDERPRALLVPTTEVALGTLYAAGIPERARVAAPSRAAYEQAVDKAALLALAAEAGLAVPRSVLVEKPETLAALPEGFRYPVFLKARRSRFRREDGRWQRGGGVPVEGEDAFRIAARDPGLRGGALLQSSEPGRGEGLFFAADRGRVVAWFAHRRLREKPPWGGVAVLCESIDPDPALLGPAARVVERLGWHGIGMFEFRRRPDGQAVLMELNPRPWGSLQLALDAGADFAGWQLALHAGGPPPQGRPRAGVRLRWLLGDVDHLLIGLRDARARRAVGAGRAQLVARFAREFGGGTRFDVWSADDPAPFRVELRGWVRALRAGAP